MTDPRSHVRPGQPLALAAEQVNWINAQMRSGLGFGGGPIGLPQSPYTALPCRNTTDQVVAQWSGIQITGLATIPNAQGDGGTPQFRATPVLLGGALEANAKSWGVAVEPIKPGEIGRVAVSGVVQAKVRAAAASEGGGSEVKAEAGGLRTAYYGEARVLWVEPGQGSDKWALVHVGGGSGDGVAAIIEWTGSWPSDAPDAAGRTVTLLGTSEEIKALNLFAEISGSCGQRHGAVVQHRGKWYLVATQFN